MTMYNGAIQIGARVKRMRCVVRRLGHPRDTWEKTLEVMERRGYLPKGANGLRPYGDLSTLGSDDGFEEIWSELSDADDHDADRELSRTIYRAVFGSPGIVVETGVARGATSYVILSALKRAGTGRLWSVDLPPVRHDLAGGHSALVPRQLRTDWELLLGTSRRLLPGLLEQLGRIDVFVHDSSHSERNMRFEYELAWTHIRSGGVLISDDIHANAAFGEFVGQRGCPYMVGEWADGRGLFGLAIRRHAPGSSGHRTIAAHDAQHDEVTVHRALPRLHAEKNVEGLRPERPELFRAEGPLSTGSSD
jgi:hypothetical protein